MRIRNKWIELETNTDHTHWTLSYNVPSDDCDSWNWWANRAKGEKPIHRAWLTIGIWHMYFRLCLWKVTPFKGSFEMDNTKRYGFTYFERSLHLHWGETHVFWLPWQWECVRHDLLLPNGDLYWRNKYPSFRLGEKKKHYSWYNILEMDESPFPKSDVQVQAAEFIELTHYTKSGKKQVAKIRLCGEEREWRWRWFRWLPWPNIKRRVVDCWSNEELGERAGSWKGGMMGWSVDWEEGESMKHAFWRWYKKWDGN